jgi:hypothetical protein
MSAYFDHVRLADTIGSLKLVDRDVTDIAVSAASHNQSTANAIANILLSHK